MRHAVARDPDHYERAPQSFDHQRRDKAATITSNIDNERVLPDLRKVKLRELVQTGPAHVRNVQIGDFSARFFVHVIDVLLHPIDIVKRPFVVGGHNGHVTRSGIGWFGIHAQDHLFAGGADEGVVKIRQAGDGRVVNRENVVTGFHVHADICERRARVFVPIFARQNALDAIGARGRVAGKFRAEQPELDARRVRAFSPGDVSVTIVQFANELA